MDKCGFLLCIGLLLIGCEPGTILGPTLTPTPTNTPFPTMTATVAPTEAPLVDCADRPPIVGIGETIETHSGSFTVTSVTRQKVLESEHANVETARGEWVIVVVELGDLKHASLHDSEFSLCSADGSNRYRVDELSEARWLYQQARGYTLLIDPLTYGVVSLDTFLTGPIRTALVYDVDPPGQQLIFWAHGWLWSDILVDLGSQ